MRVETKGCNGPNDRHYPHEVLPPDYRRFEFGGTLYDSSSHFDFFCIVSKNSADGWNIEILDIDTFGRYPKKQVPLEYLKAILAAGEKFAEDEWAVWDKQAD